MSQKSILNYFTKTPTPTTKGNSNGATTPKSTVAQSPTLSKGSEKSSDCSTTPKGRKSQSNGKMSMKNKNGTPTSSKKRPPGSSDTSAETSAQTQKRRKVGSSPNPDSTPVSKTGRRFSRILIAQDSSEEDEDPKNVTMKSETDVDEYKPDKDTTLESEEEESGDTSTVSEEEVTTDDVVTEEEDDTPEGGKRKKTVAITYSKAKRPFKTPDVPKISKPKPSMYNTPVPSPKLKGNMKNGDDSERGWPYLSYDWLKQGRLLDKKRRRSNDPEYDPKTLYVPKDFLDKCTPASRQWWEMKSTNFDTILFFKMGKFYELYHMDAVIAVQELGFVFMKGEHAHCGFPEIAYSQNAEILVERGYKVARCEQTETPDMMIIRTKGKGATKFDKVVRREICQVTTKGIRLASAQDYRTMPFRQNSDYLYAIVERAEVNGTTGTEYGVCFIDTTIGTFHIGQFKDDRYCSRLRTLFSHYSPIQILQEKGKPGASLDVLLRNMTGVRKDVLVPETEFWGCSKTLRYLAEGSYFKDVETGPIVWPETLQELLSKNDTLGLTPAEGWDLGLKCLGGLISYLRACLVEHDILTLRRFAVYSPLDVTPVGKIGGKSSGGSKFMVLDGNTLRNLEVTEGSKSLLSFLDTCATSFGKRLLRYWTCVPLANVVDIKQRQDAIEELMGLGDLTKKIGVQLKTLLDLERLLGKIHSFGSVHRSQEHPDSRASFFEAKKYSKRKITDLVSVLKGFKTTVEIMNTIKHSNTEFNSDLLRDLVSEFPDLKQLLKYFDDAFDHKAAVEAGNIKPVPGMVKEYDAAFEAIEDIQKEADAYLKEMKKVLHVSKLCYFGSDKKRFQLEIPENVTVGRDFDLSSTRKGFKRYTTKQTKEFLAKLIAAEAHRENVVKDITRRVFAQFDESREIWNKAVKCMSTLDTLISLAKFSMSQENMCRPEVVASPTPFITVVDGRHPCLEQSKYIPNGIQLGTMGKDTDEGGNKRPFLLLTGANMGGKSTIMKQTGLIAILAHIGCYVPAISCVMSAIDRIFTRIGASDNIAEGESTFYVELSETSAILRHSTPDSLILMDELGRGTATYDGNAIAYAVAKALAERGCRTVFSTHYHTLVDALNKVKTPIQVGHMACMVEREGEDDDDPTQETITFLYKLTSGPCGKSYGFNAAKLAGIPNDVIRLAHRKAKELEGVTSKLGAFRKLAARIATSRMTVEDTKRLLSALG